MAPSKSITVNKMEVNMQIPSTVNHCFLVQLLNDIICFLLYQRQQIPEPVQLLKRNYSQNSSDTNGKSKVTKMRTRQDSAFRTQVAKFLESIDSIQQTLSGAFQASHVSEILLVLGATPVSAKEIFQIDISRFASHKSTVISQRMLSLCSRKLCVRLMENEEFFIEDIGQSNVHIFIRARKGISIPGWLPWPQFKLPQNKLRLQLTLIPEGGSQQNDVLKIHEDEENVSKNLPVKMTTSKRILSDNTNITEKAGSKSSHIQPLGEKMEKLELCVQKRGEIRGKYPEENRKGIKTKENTFTEETKENVNFIMKVSSLESEKKTSLDKRKENSLSEEHGKNTKSEEEFSKQSKKIAEKTYQQMQKNSSITEIIKENSHCVLIETHIELKQETASKNMESCFVDNSVVSGSQAEQTLPGEVITESIEQTNDLKEKEDEGDTNRAPKGQQQQVVCVNGHTALESIVSHNTIEDSVKDASLTMEQSRTGNNFCSLVIENTDEISKNSPKCLESTNGSNPATITSTLFKNDEVKDQREQFLESKTGNNLGSLPGHCGSSSTCTDIANTDISDVQNPFCEPSTSSSNVTVISDEVLKSPKESSGPGDQNQSSHAGENGLIPEETAELSHNSSSKESPLNAELPQTNENNSLNHPLAKFSLSENNLPSHNSSDSCSPNGDLAEKTEAAIISYQGSATISCDKIQSTGNSVYKIMNEISNMPKKTSNSSFSNLPKNLKESQSGQGFQKQHITCREENDSVSDSPQRMNSRLVSRTGDRLPSYFWSDTEGTGSTLPSKTKATKPFPEEISKDEASTQVSTSNASSVVAKSDKFIYFKSSIVIKGFKY